MDCPRHDLETCEECPEYPCVRLVQVSALPLPRTDCTRCPIARAAADFMRVIGEEQAYQSGDAARPEWAALHERTP